jgi:2-C-methyl-D-erythritol 4-phosphate cytidylyltransferase
MGFDKLFAELHGRPVLLWAVASFERCPAITEIVVVLQEKVQAEAESIFEAAGCKKVIRLVSGGSMRHLSVAKGLAETSSTADFLAIHDAARPLVQVQEIEAVVQAARQVGAAALAAPVVETLKLADENLRVCGSVDRTRLWAMQTPQVFRRDWLEHAYKRLLEQGGSVTDEVSAVQAIGHPVQLVQGDACNLKITYPRDLLLAEQLVVSRQD